MKMLYLGVVKSDEKPGLEVCHALELRSYSRFTQSTAAQFLHFAATTLAPRADTTNPRLSVEYKGNMVHIQNTLQGVAFVCITDEEYPPPVAHNLLGKIGGEFRSKYPRTAYAEFTKDSPPLSFPELTSYLAKYQNPEEADSIMKINKELEETKIVMMQTIDSMMERGEKIDNLVAKSDGLSAQSKMFYTQAKKQNSCCTVM